jgi:uncharacterized oligopeptide transporter (OPT) family protein
MWPSHLRSFPLRRTPEIEVTTGILKIFLVPVFRPQFVMASNLPFFEKKATGHFSGWPLTCTKKKQHKNAVA